ALTAVAADNTSGKTGDLTHETKSWQKKMSDAFHDTWARLRQNKDAKDLTQSTLAVASVDLREQQDTYTVRLNLPNRDLNKVEVTLSGNTLRIVAPAEGKMGKYEQSVQLDNVAANATTQIERNQKNNLLV